MKTLKSARSLGGEQSVLTIYEIETGCRSLAGDPGFVSIVAEIGTRGDRLRGVELQGALIKCSN
ncbi:MAG: hypothetical protein D6680_07945 [Cyanobacteria bacterium J007]|jgi:hypothetical protein|nr:MAG: hypothetical protein D6680_07945 [Cyanobacteria bacterium J007]